ncbi:MAG: hypothetical protein K2L42_03165 [Clostridia bacterium]|nr:hypothetical protein [Clostridia bacterium]
MKAELKELIKNHYKNLADIEIEELANQLCDLLPRKVLRLSEIAVGGKFRYAGHEFTKLTDEEQSCYCLLNETVFESEFGETNDWAKSPIRKRLNEFDGQGKSKAVKGIAKDDLVAVSLNYRSYNNPNGRTTDRITILSYDEWLCWNIPSIGVPTWLRSGVYTYAYGAYYLYADGFGDYNNAVTREYAVRPALHFKKDLEVEI